MTYAWGVGELALLREWRRKGFKMQTIMNGIGRVHPDRDEVVEAIDAIRRYPNDLDAMDHLDFVLAGKAAGVSFINGRPWHEVSTGNGARPDVMFT